MSMSRMRLALLVVAGVLFAGAVPTAAQPLSPPREALPLSEPGPHDQRLDEVIQELRDALEARHGRLEVKAYKLGPGARFADLATYYQDALPGWEVERALPESIRAAKARAWKRGGLLSSGVLAIALIDKPVAGEKLDYKVLVVASR